MAHFLKCCLWNCWSVAPKKEELLNWSHINEVNVLLLTETWLNKTHHFNLRGFTTFRMDRDDAKGGVMIAVREDIAVSPIRIVYYHPTIQLIAVKIDEITVLLTYVKPGAKISTHFWSDILFQISPPLLFI